MCLFDCFLAVTASPSSISPYLNFDPSLINIVCINFTAVVRCF